MIKDTKDMKFREPFIANFMVSLTESVPYSIAWLKDYSNRLKQIISDIEEINRNISTHLTMLNRIRQFDDYRITNANIVRQVNKYLHSGSQLADAVVSAAEDLKSNPHDVHKIYDFSRKKRDPIPEKTIRNHMIKKMLAAGYSYRDVAEVAGVSHNYVYKIKKTGGK